MRIKPDLITRFLSWFLKDIKEFGLFYLVLFGPLILLIIGSILIINTPGGGWSTLICNGPLIILYIALLCELLRKV